MQNVMYHFSQKRISRAEGRSVTSAAAYRAGEKIWCEYEGRLHDYSHRQKKGDIGDTLLILPSGKDSTSERPQFWNSIEKHHKRGDANLAWEFELALPDILTTEQNRQLAQNYAREIAARYNVAVDVCIHRSHDGKNPHAHVMLSACQIKPDDTLGLKCNELDPIWCGQQRKKKPNLKKPSDVERPRWAELVNNALASAGHDARTDHRTLAAQGIEREPQRHNAMPNSEAAKEISAHNAQVISDALELARLDGLIEREQQELAALKAERDIETARLQQLFVDMQREDARKAAELAERQAREKSDGEKLSAGIAAMNKLGGLANIQCAMGLLPPPKAKPKEPEQPNPAHRIYNDSAAKEIDPHGMWHGTDRRGEVVAYDRAGNFYLFDRTKPDSDIRMIDAVYAAAGGITPDDFGKWLSVSVDRSGNVQVRHIASPATEKSKEAEHTNDNFGNSM